MIENFGRGFRFLSDDAAVALIRHTIQLNGKRIFFGDDIFAANRARTTRLLERLLVKASGCRDGSHRCGLKRRKTANYYV